jgi:N-acyl-D-aspartate/D-glutamate deacylase
MLNLLIKNVEIFDGTGEVSYAADVGVSGGRIVPRLNARSRGMACAWHLASLIHICILA